MRLERYHWRHFFGGVALLLLVLQLISGVFLTLFYQPHLLEAYASVQVFYKEWETAIGAWIRDGHRWIAFALFVAMVLHTVRSLLRKDFLNFEKRSRIIWLTGGLLLLPMGALLVTGFILPWEWKGYWWMEMVPNYLGLIPGIGPDIQQFLIDAFTMNRNFVAHVVILPAISLVLIELHILAKVRKRKGGIPAYLLKHTLIALPILAIIAALAVTIPMPTEDPEIIPMPLDGQFIPAPESFFLIFYMPFLYHEGIMVAVLALFLPFALYVILTVLPYLIRRRQKPEHHEPGGDAFFKEFRHVMGAILRVGFMRKLVAFMTVFITASALFGFLYLETYKSPVLGCNSCHNTAMGSGIGVPPKNFKDRTKEPKLDDSKWMLEHWYYPQLAW